MLSKLPEITFGGAGVWTGVLMMLGWWLHDRREQRKLSLADRQANREGFQKQVEMLAHENRDMGEDLRKLRQEYDAYRKICQTETDQLRTMVISNEGELEGLKRKLAEASKEIAKLKAG